MRRPESDILPSFSNGGLRASGSEGRGPSGLVSSQVDDGFLASGSTPCAPMSFLFTTVCSHFAEPPHSGNSDRGPRSLPSIPVRVYAPFHTKVYEPSGRECTNRLVPQPSTLPSGPFTQPCLERLDRGPHALPSFSRGDLRDHDHEDRRPSECEPFPIGVPSEQFVLASGP